MEETKNEPDVSEQSVQEKKEHKAELDLDWEALAIAFENQLSESHSFLELKTGKVHTVICESDVPPHSPEPHENYLYIPPRPSREGYRTMQHFIETIEEPTIRDRLLATLVGKGAFRRFKDQLLAYPEIRQQWFGFKDNEVYEYIRDWLTQEGVVATNLPPPSSSKERLPIAVRKPAPRRDWVIPTEFRESETNWKEEIAVYDRREISFRPECTALLVIDMQRVFVDPKGQSFLPMSVAVGERLVRLIECCRQRRIPVIFTRHVHQFPHQDGGAMARWWRSLIIEGTPDAELALIFSPQEGDRVLTKCRYSAFLGTPLEMLLHSMKVEDVLIGGVMTNLCCETTARDAFSRDFNVFFLGDGTATTDTGLHHASLKNIAFGFGRVLSVVEAIQTLQIG